MIGKWNKSVILTYTGLSISIIGILLVLSNAEIKYAYICLMFAGICDLFDGTVARKCKRTEEEKLFGIQLDSLVDTISFVALPLVILMNINKEVYLLPIYIIYAVFAVARLSYFNITAHSNGKAVKYYEGLPVTYTALIFPITFLLSKIIDNNLFIIIYNLTTILVSILFILKIKVIKPKLISSIILFISSILLTIVYLFVL